MAWPCCSIRALIFCVAVSCCDVALSCCDDHLGDARYDGPKGVGTCATPPLLLLLSLGRAANSGGSFVECINVSGMPPYQRTLPNNHCSQPRGLSFRIQDDNRRGVREMLVMMEKWTWSILQVKVLNAQWAFEQGSAGRQLRDGKKFCTVRSAAACVIIGQTDTKCQARGLLLPPQPASGFEAPFVCPHRANA